MKCRMMNCRGTLNSLSRNRISIDFNGPISLNMLIKLSASNLLNTLETLGALSANLKKLEPLKEYNILLLGESGAGKSTTINAIANYIKYKTFEEAANSEFLQLIPSNFSLPDPVHLGKTMEIKTGSNINERTEEGGSRTKDPMGYPFRFGDKLIRIIDTPGIGDTEGAETDKKNFDKILDYLHFHKVSNGCLQLF